MGFIKGFSGGAALTLGTAYWTLRTHYRQRHAQSNALSAHVEELAAMETAAMTASSTESAPARPFTMTETLKARWNDEVIAGVDWLHQTDWNSLVWKLWALRSANDQLSPDHDSEISDHHHAAELHEPAKVRAAIVAQAGQADVAPITTDIAAALEQRYHRPHGSEKSVAETLQDRYQPH